MLLTLPTLPESTTRRKNASESTIDYIKSILLTLDKYIAQLGEKTLKKCKD